MFQKSEWIVEWLRENRKGKVSYSNPMFGEEEAKFTEKTIDEVIYNSTFPEEIEEKLGILININDYLLPNASLTKEKPKDNKDKARCFFVLDSEYKGKNDSLIGKRIQIVFRENQNGTINIHFIRLPFDKKRKEFYS